MKKLLIMQENEFFGTLPIYPSTMQPFCTHVDKHVTSNFQICFPAPYLSLHAKYSYMPRGRTSLNTNSYNQFQIISIAEYRFNDSKHHIPY